MCMLQVLALRAPESGGGPFMITTRTFPEVMARLTKCAVRPSSKSFDCSQSIESAMYILLIHRNTMTAQPSIRSIFTDASRRGTELR